MRPRLKKAASYGLMAVCTAFIVHLFVTGEADLALFLRLSPASIVAITLLQIGQVVLGGARYWLVVEKCSGRHIAFMPWLRIFVVARCLGFVVPQSGNIYRGIHLKKRFGVSYTRYAGSFLAFTWIGLTINLAVAGVAVAIWAPDLRFGPAMAQWLLVSLAAVVGGGPLCLNYVLQRVRVRGTPFVWLRAKGGEAMTAAVAAVLDWRHLCCAVGLGLAAFVLGCLIVWVGLSSLEVSIGVGELALFYALLQLSTYVHLTPGNFAVQEIAFAVIGQQIGITIGEGIVAASLLRICSYAATFALAFAAGGIDIIRNARRASS